MINRGFALMIFLFLTFLCGEEGQASYVDSVGYIYNFVLPPFELIEVDSLGGVVVPLYEGRRFERLRMEGMVCRTKCGTPELPVYEFQMSVPSKEVLPTFELISSNYDTINTSLPMYPKQIDCKRNKGRETFSSLIHNKKSRTYKSVKTPIQISELKENRGVTTVIIRITPFSYNSTDNTLEVLRQSTIKIGLSGEAI